MWNKTTGYSSEVHLSEVIEDMAAFLPSPGNLLLAHEWSKKIFRDSSSFLIIRGGYTCQSNPGLNFKGCSRVYTLEGGPTICTTDNEFSASLYEIFRGWGRVVTASRGSEITLKTLFQNFGLVTGTIKPKPINDAERVVSKQILFALIGTSPKMAPTSVQNLYTTTARTTHDLKYSHILSLKDQSDLNDQGANAAEELRARFFRIISPFNMFPTPKPSAYKHSASGPLTQDDIGETFQLAMAAKIRGTVERLPGGIEAWSEYCAMAKAPPEFSDVGLLNLATESAKHTRLLIQPHASDSMNLMTIASAPRAELDFDALPPELAARFRTRKVT